MADSPLEMVKFFALLVLCCPPAVSAVRWTNGGVALHRTDASNIQFKLNSSTADALGGPSAIAAIQAALNSWNAIPNTALHFAPLGSTSAGFAGDGQNVIVFAASPSELATIGNALSATMPYGFADGRVTETDILLNPNVKYSTTGESGAWDLQAVVTHELGHALGANHTPSLSSTMFWTIGQQDVIWSQLKADDAAFAVEAYPGAGVNAAYGKITGHITKDGAALPGAAIIATDPLTGISIGGLSSLADGSYALTVPLGVYNLYAAPVSPFTPPGFFYGLSAGQFDTNFKAAVGPVALNVTGGATVSADISTTAGSAALGIVEMGKVANGTTTWRSGVLEINSGQSTDVILFGPGLDSSIGESNIALVGPGLSLRAGTLRIDSGLKDSSGYSAMRFTLDAAATGALTSATLYVSKGVDAAMVGGGIAIYPAARPSLTAAGIGNAATGLSGSVAPGELISLYAAGIGPGTVATFDGITAPVLYAGAGQINLQVPYEVSGKSETVVVVKTQAGASDPLGVPVVNANPGIFAAVPNPVSRGAYITLYATGGGVVSPAVPTGKPAPDSPLSFAQSVFVQIAGLDAPVYVGGVLSPGFIGLLQIAAQVPQAATTGKVQVTLTVAGQTSPPLTITIN